MNLRKPAVSSKIPDQIIVRQFYRSRRSRRDTATRWLPLFPRGPNPVPTQPGVIRHYRGMGIGCAVARPCIDREFALDLASHLHGAVGNRRWHDRAIDHRRRRGAAVLGTDESWVKFLSGLGAIVLTFLAGAELDPQVFRLKWKEAASVGLVSFFFPFIGCAAAAHYLLGWEAMPSWLAGVAMSTTSVAVVYAVMLEFGFNTTEYGKTILAACFVTDLGTVVALGLIFAPFTIKTLIFLGVGIVVFIVLPWITPRFFRLYGNRPSELEAKFLLLCLLGMGALAAWADSEAVLPAYLIGMVLAGTVGKDHALIRRLRTLTFGLLTPFYFIRAGSFVPSRTSLPRPSHSFFFPRQGWDQDHRRIPRHQIIRLAQPGGDVHNPVDVHRPHLRHHLGVVRPFAWDH